MDQKPAATPPRLRGASLFLARAAALVVSIGVVVVIAAQAGVAGCSSSSSGVQPEARSADTPNATAPGASPAATGSAVPEEDDPVFMGGSKAPAGAWARPRKPSSATPASPSGQNQAPQQAPNAPPQGQR